MGSKAQFPLYRAKPTASQHGCLHPSSTFQLSPRAFVTTVEVCTPQLHLATKNEADFFIGGNSVELPLSCCRLGGPKGEGPCVFGWCW